MGACRGEDRWRHFGQLAAPAEELGQAALAEHERAVTLYRNTYREQEPLHASRFASQ